MRCAVVTGVQTCALPISDSLSEYEFAGLLRGERTRVWHSERTGLDAPAGAEILIEGVIHPGDTALEAPFGDHTGYYTAADHFPVLSIERMSLRRGPIYQASYVGPAPFHEPSVLAMALNVAFVPNLGEVCPSTEKRRVGNECVRTFRSRCALHSYKKNKQT